MDLAANSDISLKNIRKIGVFLFEKPKKKSSHTDKLLLSLPHPYSLLLETNCLFKTIVMVSLA